MATSRGKADEFKRKFEGREVLDGLLELAGSAMDSDQVLEAMEEANRQGEQVAGLIPTFFEEEPRFTDPSLAQRMFENLLGLWDAVAAGKPVRLDPPPPRPPKKAPPPPPGYFHPGEVTAEWLASARVYLKDAEPRTRNRLHDAFENREDALLTWLDEQALSDEGYSCARQALFELFAMLELGLPRGVGSARVERASLDAEVAPQALRELAEQAVRRSPDAEAKQVADAVMQGLSALWRVRRQ